MSENLNNIFVPFIRNDGILALVHVMLIDMFLKVTKRFNNKILKAAIRAVFGVFKQVFEDKFHIRFNNVSEIDRVKYVGKYAHKSRQINFFFFFIVIVNILVMEKLKNFQTIFQDLPKIFTLFLAQFCLLVYTTLYSSCSSTQICFFTVMLCQNITNYSFA